MQSLLQVRLNFLFSSVNWLQRRVNCWRSAGSFLGFQDESHCNYLWCYYRVFSSMVPCLPFTQDILGLWNDLGLGIAWRAVTIMVLQVRSLCTRSHFDVYKSHFGFVSCLIALVPETSRALKCSNQHAWPGTLNQIKITFCSKSAISKYVYIIFLRLYHMAYSYVSLLLLG